MTEIRFTVYADGEKIVDTMVQKDGANWDAIARSYPEYFTTVIGDKVVVGEKPDDRLKIEYV